MAMVGMKMDCMMRPPMLKPAWAAAPKSAISQYTAEKYTNSSSISPPAGRPILNIRVQMSTRGFHSVVSKDTYFSSLMK